MVLLTKSKYMSGLQCEKLLWIIYNAPEKIPKVSLSTQFRFDAGNEVGNYAKLVFPNGVGLSSDFKKNLEETINSLSKGKPLFEAGFMTNNLYSRIDILNPVNKNEWDIIEVKSTASVKDEHIHDVSFQKYTAELAGLKIRKCHLMYLNNKYIRNGEIVPKELFIIEDITDRVNKASLSIDKRITHMFDIISQKTMPEIKIGDYCSSPYECSIMENCWKFLPEHSVFDLYRIGPKSFELLEEGVLAIKDLPKDFKLSDKQQIQLECEITGKPYIDKKSITNFLNTLKYPLYYLDFETLNPAIPLYNKLKPYQRIPFQFSLDVVDENKTIHKDFLHDSKEDPRAIFLKKLKDYLGENGSIVTYNQTFELGVIKELVELYPEYKEWEKNIRTRTVDLLVPFKNFAYYNPLQKGSASIKNVLPALTTKSYSDLEINNGDLANISYYNSIYGNLKNSEVDKIRKNLLLYCAQDTESMVLIVNRLKELVK